ncbi:hypothetical protein D6C91_09732 [Aureobasidium pullulans]|uniref:Uncharacterized protein n=1 Tax=Aureobasidium pullulans TaxID=5580 RepID=A0A4S9SI17_AURPU|nr:hypothetical protein D6C91_09732 [Aureobasidium pullulans]
MSKLFRTQVVPTIVGDALVTTFLRQFDAHLVQCPILRQLAFLLGSLYQHHDGLSAEHRQSHQSTPSEHSKTVMDHHIDFMLNIGNFFKKDAQKSPEATFILMTMLSPFHLYMARLLSQRDDDYTIRICRTLYGLSIYQRDLRDSLLELSKQPDFGLLLRSNIGYAPLPSDDELQDIKPVEMFYSLIDTFDSPAIPEIAKPHLRLAVDNLFILIVSVSQAIEKNRKETARNPTHVPVNNDRKIFTWILIERFPPEFWALTNERSSERPHPIFQALLCFWGLLCGMKNNVWYFEGVGYRLLQDFLVVARDKDIVAAGDKPLAGVSAWQTLLRPLVGKLGAAHVDWVKGTGDALAPESP